MRRQANRSGEPATARSGYWLWFKGVFFTNVVPVAIKKMGKTPFVRPEK